MAESLPLEQPDMSRRQLLNFLTGATVAAAVGGAAYPVGKYFTPPAEGDGSGALVAKDKLGNIIPASQILSQPVGTRALISGLAGEPTYLTVEPGQKLNEMGIVDNCTHLGCTFPWNDTAAEFQCPCHGSRYDGQGNVLRGPANRPLKLVKVAVRDDLIWVAPWTDLDPRTGVTPWWA
ncbi:cytochrome b6-f complex iron-sulfur subunit [Geitlerinema sp. CS-897]|nr:cytochrome b6-f complex iron-sulfur subunit [Geitlerinema sp. CS-897]